MPKTPQLKPKKFEPFKKFSVSNNIGQQSNTRVRSILSDDYLKAGKPKIPGLGYIEPMKPKEEKKPSLEREPIYYIVERKTKRAKASYGEPKQINFKP